MKRLFTAILIVLFLATFAHADAQTSGKQTATAVLYAGPCVVTVVKLVEAGADATLYLYDSATATTTSKTARDYTEIDSGENVAQSIYPRPVTFYEGVYAVLTGANAFYFIHIEPR